MSRRRIIDAAPEPESLEPIDPLRASSAEVWARWSRDRETRQLQQHHARLAAEQEQRELPIYPAELAQRIAEDTDALAPDWRAMDGTRGAAWGKLLRLQPELAPEITGQREAVLTAILNTLPRHLQPSVHELRTLITFLLTGHEAAAYLVGFEAGRRRERQHIDARGRTRQDRRAPRVPVTGLRLHLDDGGCA